MWIIANYPGDDVCSSPIVVNDGDLHWEEIHKRYIAGKNPTDDNRWKAGVYCRWEKDNA